MKQLNTIQKMEKLNDVFAIDEVGPGGRAPLIPGMQAQHRTHL